VTLITKARYKKFHTKLFDVDNVYYKGALEYAKRCFLQIMLAAKAQDNLGTYGVYYNKICVVCLLLPKELITLVHCYWRSLHGKCGDGEAWEINNIITSC